MANWFGNDKPAEDEGCTAAEFMPCKDCVNNTYCSAEVIGSHTKELRKFYQRNQHPK